MSIDTRIDSLDGGAERSLRELAETAYLRSEAPPLLAATVLSRARRARWRRRGVVGSVLAGAVLASSVGAVTVGGGSDYEFRQPSAVMEPAVPTGARVVVDGDLSPARLDVVQVSLPLDGPDVEGLLRVVGVSGDSVGCARLTPSSCAVTVNGEPVPDSYVAALDTAPFDEVRVPSGSVFVLGDVRDAAVDSREFGPIDVGEVGGVVVAVLDASGRVGPVPGAPSHPVPDDYEIDPERPVPPAFTDQG